MVPQQQQPSPNVGGSGPGIGGGGSNNSGANNIVVMQKSVAIVTPQRSNSLDYLNFEEKRQLIASSLSLSDILHCGPAAAAAAAKEVAANTVIGMTSYTHLFMSFRKNPLPCACFSSCVENIPHGIFALLRKTIWIDFFLFSSAHLFGKV